MERLTRRRVLQSAIAGSAGLAGCLGGSGGSTDSSGIDDNPDSSPQASTASQGAGGLTLDGRELKVTQEIPHLEVREVAFDGIDYLEVAVANTGNADVEVGGPYLGADFYDGSGEKLNTYEKEASITTIGAGSTGTVRIRLLADPERVERIARVELRMTCVDVSGEGVPYCSN